MKRLFFFTFSALVVSLPASAAPGGAIDLSVDATTGIEGLIYGPGLGDQLGHALATGDLNDDGEADLVVAAVGIEFVSVFFGPLPSGSIDVTDNSAIYQGIRAGEAGWSVAVGDLTGDGIDDLVVSEPSALSGGGEVVVIEGPLAEDTWYDHLSSEVAYTFSGEKLPAPEYAGWDLAIGDFDGDGKDDLVVGACGAADTDPEVGDPLEREIGLAYFISQTDMNLYSAAPLRSTATSRIWGLGNTGCAVANAGDTNGDGFDDILLGSLGLSASSTATATGAATIVEGRETWSRDYRLASYYTSPPSLGINVLPGIYTLMGPANDGQNVGSSVSGVGDVNNDGYADILIGAPAHQTTTSTAPSSTSSRAYLVYGAPDGTGLKGISELASNAALVVEASNATHLGWDVAPAGDIDGDGSDDYLLGSLSGSGYLFYGVNDPSFSVSYLCATSGSCTASYTATTGLTGTLGTGDAGASFSDGSATSYAGRTLLGTPDMTGDNTPDLVIGAPAQESFGTTNHGPGYTYIFSTK